MPDDPEWRDQRGVRMSHPNSSLQLPPEIYALDAIGPGDLFGELPETEGQKEGANEVPDFTGPK